MKKLLLLVTFTVLFSSLNIDQAMAVGPMFDVSFDIEVADFTGLGVLGAQCTISDPGTGIVVSGATDGNGDVQLIINTMTGNKIEVECTNGSDIKTDSETITNEVNVNIVLILPQLAQVIGGEIIPIESTSLLLAGAQSSFVWILPLVLVGAGFSAYKIRHRL